MSRQISLLVRLGEETLAGLIGSDIVELVTILDEKKVGARALATLLLEIKGKDCTLTSKTVRHAIFNSLPKAEAIELAQSLGRPGLTPWTDLDQVNFRKGTESYSVLSDWMEFEEVSYESNSAEKLEKRSHSIPEYPLFSHQIDAIRKVRSAIANGNGRVVLHMPTGSGKTRSAMNIIADEFRCNMPAGRCAVWLAHSEELCDQAAAEFEKAWRTLGNRPVNIVRHYGSYSKESLEEIRDAFVVIGLKSAHALAFSNERDSELFELGRQAGIVVVDEAHKAIAETYQHVLDLLAPPGSCKLVGLTATPGRSWLDIGEDEKLANFFDRKKVTLDVIGYDSPIDFLVSEGYLAKVSTEEIRYDGGPDLSESEIEQLTVNGEVPRAALVRIASDVARNLRILLRAQQEAKSGNSVILFACSVEHARALSSILTQRGIRAACVTGTTPPNERQRRIQEFRDGKISILCNYDILSTGFDAPKANVAIIARPTKSLVLYSQMVGRVIRGPQANGTEKCKVITVVDQKYGFRNLGEAFTFWDDLWEEQ